MVLLFFVVKSDFKVGCYKGRGLAHVIFQSGKVRPKWFDDFLQNLSVKLELSSSH